MTLARRSLIVLHRLFLRCGCAVVPHHYYSAIPDLIRLSKNRYTLGPVR